MGMPKLAMQMPRCMSSGASGLLQSHSEWGWPSNITEVPNNKNHQKWVLNFFPKWISADFYFRRLHVLHSIQNLPTVAKMMSKVEKILKRSLDSISSPPQTFSENSNNGVKIYLRRKGKTLLGIDNKTFCIQKFVDNIQQCFAFTTFLSIIWIFTEGDGIKYNLLKP